LHYKDIEHCRKVQCCMASAGLVGERLLEWRQRRKLSQQVLGEKIGADGPRIHRLEKGAENPTLDTLDRLAAALDIDTSQLLAPRPVEDSGRDRTQVDPLLADAVARLDRDTPAEDTWRGDVLKAIAVLTRALRRSDAPGESAAPPAKVGR
jgi:transcriptional regulator with XRE-family HTH domain